MMFTFCVMITSFSYRHFFRFRLSTDCFSREDRRYFECSELGDSSPAVAATISLEASSWLSSKAIFLSLLFAARAGGRLKDPVLSEGRRLGYYCVANMDMELSCDANFWMSTSYSSWRLLGRRMWAIEITLSNLYIYSTNLGPQELWGGRERAQAGVGQRTDGDARNSCPGDDYKGYKIIDIFMKIGDC